MNFEAIWVKKFPPKKKYIISLMVIFLKFVHYICINILNERFSVCLQQVNLLCMNSIVDLICVVLVLGIFIFIFLRVLFNVLCK